MWFNVWSVIKILHLKMDNVSASTDTSSDKNVYFFKMILHANHII